MSAQTLRIILPYHLQVLACSEREVTLAVALPASAGAIIDALETRYPLLKGTMRDHGSRKRRALVRFFACGEDWSNEPMDAPVPQKVATGAEPFIILGAIAGG